MAADCGSSWDSIKDDDEVTNTEGCEDDRGDVFLDVLQRVEWFPGMLKFQVGYSLHPKNLVHQGYGHAECGVGGWLCSIGHKSDRSGVV